MSALKLIQVAGLLSCCGLSLYAQPSVLHAGDWYKFGVERNGIYRISYDLLRKAGIDPSKIDPRDIRIFGREGGMLPQSNSIPRPSDLMECAIAVAGEDDGRFDQSDYILFYGEGPDDYEYDIARGIYRYENNIYSDHNYYFLTVGPERGKRIASSENVEGDFPLITTFNAFSYYENDAVNIEHSGREWYGERFGTQNIYTLTYNVSGIPAGSTIKVVSDVMGQSYTDASFKLYFNDVQIAEQAVAPISSGRYAIKGSHNLDTFSINADNVGAAARSSQELKYEFAKGTGVSQGYLNFALVDFMRNLTLYGNQTFFLSAASLAHSHCTFRVTGTGTDTRIWDITDHYNPKEQQFTRAGTDATFSTATDALKKWMVFNSNYPEPVFVSKVANKDLSGLATPNLLIVTYPDFRSEAERLGAHRATWSNWTVEVATTEEIYNQFSGGRQDVTAIRDFVKFLHDKSPGALRAVLLFGRASYDYKDRLPNNTNFVPTYQSRNSLNPLMTYSSDDYFVFLEPHEGNWQESPAEDHTLDAGVGRLPVTSLEEARVVVDKIIDYDSNHKALGSWRKKIVFVADDGNTEDDFDALHQYQADQLALIIEQDNPAFDARRIFMGSYKKISQPNGERVPDMVNDIKRAFDLGAVIINFTGHGSEKVWTDERVLTEETVAALRNERYPFLVTATCEFGRQDDPAQFSSAERSLTHPDGGSIGLVTTSRPVNARTNFALNAAFYEALFEDSDDGYAAIGEVFRKTKNNSTSGVANRNFSLIGDPSMTLGLPGYSAEVTYLKTAGGSDTLKALSTVTARGRILGPGGGLAPDFEGVVELTLYDKEREFTTIGKNNPPFKYTQWDNAVFRGRASVHAGKFELSFVMPMNISEEVAPGRLSLYAFDPNTGRDAKGVHTTNRIGGIEPDPGSDVTPPHIRLYMGDTTFVNGGITSPDTYLVARLEDESGINISGYGGGNGIIATLDDSDETFLLSDYYVADLDTWKRGTVRYPLLGLAPGRHELTLYAWDVYNNPAEATIAFVVTDGEQLVIEDFGNYPNPFRDNTTVFFTHNRSGDDLRAQLFIFSPQGQLIRSAEVSLPESEYHIKMMELNTWDESGKKLPPGPYLARVIVRSITNGSKNEKVTKLIVLN